MSFRARSLLLLATLALLAGCGDDSTEGMTSAPSTSAPVSTTTASVLPAIDVPFLDAKTNAVLRSCAAGDPAACDAAQVPGVLDDGAFSLFHKNCDAGDRTWCRLLDNLVAAELRMHGVTTTR